MMRMVNCQYGSVVLPAGLQGLNVSNAPVLFENPAIISTLQSFLISFFLYTEIAQFERALRAILLGAGVDHSLGSLPQSSTLLLSASQQLVRRDQHLFRARTEWLARSLPATDKVMKTKLHNQKLLIY
jgi:hypothetical protein